MLLQRIGEIFGNDLSAELERFRVLDRGMCQDELRVVLLLESPHTDEVRPSEICNRYPLAGKTGKDTRDLLDERLRNLGRKKLPDKSIGELVHRGCPDFIRQLGIMNVSQLPFQEDAYQVFGAEPNSEKFKNYADCMKTIRGGPFALARQNNDCKKLDDAISEDLRVRLVALYGRKSDVLLIRCGEVAQGFYMKACKMKNYLPHPSEKTNSRGWQNLNSQGKQCLQKILHILSQEAQ